MSTALFLATGWRITSPYGMRIHPVYKDTRQHRGIDLVKPAGAAIEAFVAGGVRFAAGLGAYGLAVIVEDARGRMHVYGHMSSLAVKVGDSVRAGQALGIQGTTGLSTGPHVHYEVRTGQAPNWGYTTDVDPGKYLLDYLRMRPLLQATQHIALVHRGKQLPIEGLLIGQAAYVPLRAYLEAVSPTTQIVDYKDGVLTTR